jgi:hypothetical protein
MRSVRFDRLFAGLVGAFKRYHSTPRSPDGIPRLAVAREQLDDARGAMADERDRLRIRTGREPGPVRKYAVPDEKLAKLRVAQMKDLNRGS